MRLFVSALFFLMALASLQAQENIIPSLGDTLNTNFSDSDLVADTTDMPQNLTDTSKEFFPAFDFNDSSKAFIFDERFNIRSAYIRSLGHDASDFLKFSPSNFIITNLSTPNRTTVSPFNLPGNRFSIIFNNQQINPLDNITGPDYKIDFNDIPTAPVQNIYNIEGPLGMFFGADNAIASLILEAHDPVSVSAESKMVADVGSYGYAYTKGLFTHRNAAGRSIKASVAYRKADGLYGYSDESYHQWGELTLPLKKKLEIYLEGRMYNRNGLYAFETYGAEDRKRLDRDLSAGLVWHHNDKASSSIQYRSQQSNLDHDLISQDSKYKSESFDRSIDVKHSHLSGAWNFELNGLVNQESFQEINKMTKRYGGEFTIKLMTSQERGRILFMGGVHKYEGYKSQPLFMAAFILKGDRHYLAGTIGIVSKYPILYELTLSTERAPEKQYTGNITYALGQAGNDIQLSLTGGLINNGIDWTRAVDDPLRYSAINSKIKFANITISKNINWNKWLILSGGGSYRYNEIDRDRFPPYSPNYQLFATLQIHRFIETLGLNLFAYTELLYNAEYTGYNQEKYGEDPIVNAKLSFKIKKFHFYYVFQNVIGTEYFSRENRLIPGRYNWYGVTWEFLD
ncbi:MAG: hypothetical protein ABIJ45_06665 [Candidatus Zixiibacteriota bacterium]